MTNDDFDKDIDNEFAEEFDFVDDDSAKPVANTATSAATTSPAAGGSSSKIKIMVVLAIIVGGGYFGYKIFAGAPDEQPTNVSPLPAPIPSTVDSTVDSSTTPPMPTTALPMPENNKVDFNSTSSAPPMPTSPDDQLANALPPQTKTFDQMQKDLQVPKSSHTKTAIPDEINATLDSISEEMTLNVNQIKSLDATITSLANSVNQLNKSVGAMDNRVLGLTETVDGLVQDLANVKRIMANEDLDLTSTNKIKYSNKNQTRPLSGETPEYAVHAIIPGRAWLKSSSGQIITVTEGDRVGDYGTVAVIDAANGIVRTSSGITFR